MIRYKLTHPNAKVPTKATPEATGYDLYSVEDVTLVWGERRLVSTGLILEPLGLHELDIQVRPRSGLAFNYGVTILNTPGTIDSDYRGEIKVLLINLGDTDEFKIKVGDRIGQLVFGLAIKNITMFPAEDLGSTDRGSGGFGSTGT